MANKGNIGNNKHVEEVEHVEEVVEEDPEQLAAAIAMSMVVPAEGANNPAPVSPTTTAAPQQQSAEQQQPKKTKTPPTAPLNANSSSRPSPATAPPYNAADYQGGDFKDGHPGPRDQRQQSSAAPKTKSNLDAKSIQAELESKIQCLEFLRADEKEKIVNFSVLKSSEHPHVQLDRVVSEEDCIDWLQERLLELKKLNQNAAANELIKYFLKRYPYYNFSINLFNIFYTAQLDSDRIELEQTFVDYFRTAEEHAIDRLDDICLYDEALSKVCSKFEAIFLLNKDESPRLYQQLKELGWLDGTTDKVFVAHERVYQAFKKFFDVAKNLFKMVKEFQGAIQAQKFDRLKNILERHLPNFDPTTQLKLKEKIRLVIKPFRNKIPLEAMIILGAESAMQPIVRAAAPKKESKAQSVVPTRVDLNKQFAELIALRAQEEGLRKADPANPEIAVITRQRSELEKKYVASFVTVLNIFLDVPGGYFAAEKLVANFFREYPYYGHSILLLLTFFDFHLYKECEEYLAKYFQDAQAVYLSNRSNWNDIQAQHGFFLKMWPAIKSHKKKMARDPDVNPQSLHFLNLILQQVTEFALFTGLVLLEHALPIAQSIPNQDRSAAELKTEPLSVATEQKGWALILNCLKALEMRTIENTQSFQNTLERVKARLQLSNVEASDIRTIIKMVEQKCAGSSAQFGERNQPSSMRAFMLLDGVQEAFERKDFLKVYSIYSKALLTFEKSQQLAVVKDLQAFIKQCYPEAEQLPQFVVLFAEYNLNSSEPPEDEATLSRALAMSLQPGDATEGKNAPPPSAANGITAVVEIPAAEHKAGGKIKLSNEQQMNAWIGLLKELRLLEASGLGQNPMFLKLTQPTLTMIQQELNLSTIDPSNISATRVEAEQKFVEWIRQCDAEFKLKGQTAATHELIEYFFQHYKYYGFHFVLLRILCERRQFVMLGKILNPHIEHIQQNQLIFLADIVSGYKYLEEFCFLVTSLQTLANTAPEKCIPGLPQDKRLQEIQALSRLCENLKGFLDLSRKLVQIGSVPTRTIQLLPGVAQALTENPPNFQAAYDILAKTLPSLPGDQQLREMDNFELAVRDMPPPDEMQTKFVLLFAPYRNAASAAASAKQKSEMKAAESQFESVDLQKELDDRIQLLTSLRTVEAGIKTNSVTSAEYKAALEIVKSKCKLQTVNRVTVLSLRASTEEACVNWLLDCDAWSKTKIPNDTGYKLIKNFLQRCKTYGWSLILFKVFCERMKFIEMEELFIPYVKLLQDHPAEYHSSLLILHEYLAEFYQIIKLYQLRGTTNPEQLIQRGMNESNRVKELASLNNIYENFGKLLELSRSIVLPELSINPMAAGLLSLVKSIAPPQEIFRSADISRTPGTSEQNKGQPGGAQPKPQEGKNSGGAQDPKPVIAGSTVAPAKQANKSLYMSLSLSPVGDAEPQKKPTEKTTAPTGLLSIGGDSDDEEAQMEAEAIRLSNQLQEEAKAQTEAASAQPTGDGSNSQPATPASVTLPLPVTIPALTQIVSPASQAPAANAESASPQTGGVQQSNPAPKI